MSSNINAYHKFATDAGIYGLSQIVILLGGILLLPIITKILGTYGYGIWTQISITITLIAPMASLGLSLSLVRFLAAEENKEHIRESFYSVIFFVIFLGTIISLIFLFASDFIAFYIFRDADTAFFLKIAAFLILFTALDQIAVFYFRIFQQIGIFALLNILQALGQIVFIIIFLYFGYELVGVISGTLLIRAAMFCIAILIIIRQIGFTIPQFTVIKPYLHFGLPLSQNSTISWITNSSDRYIIGYFLGLSQVGIYSSSYAIGFLIFSFVTPIQIILFPKISKLFDENNLQEVRTYLEYSVRYFLLITIPAAFGLSFLAEPLLLLLTTPEFITGSIIVPFVALGGIFLGLFQIFVNITFLVKQTKYNIYYYTAGAIVNIILNFIFIPIIGILGAAISTTISFALMSFLIVNKSRRILTFDFDILYIVKYIAAALIMTISLIILDPNGFSIFIGIPVAIGVYITALILLKGISHTELQFFLEILPFRRYILRMLKIPWSNVDE